MVNWYSQTRIIYPGFFMQAKKSKRAIKIALTFKEQQMILLENGVLLTP